MKNFRTSLDDSWAVCVELNDFKLDAGRIFASPLSWTTRPGQRILIALKTMTDKGSHAMRCVDYFLFERNSPKFPASIIFTAVCSSQLRSAYFLNRPKASLLALRHWSEHCRCTVWGTQKCLPCAANGVTAPIMFVVLLNYGIWKQASFRAVSHVA